jgi:hypothetical protein
MIDDFLPTLRLDVTAGRPPVMVDATEATDPRNIYTVLSENGKLAVVFTVPCGCNCVAEFLRAYGLPHDSLVVDMGRCLCYDEATAH